MSWPLPNEYAEVDGWPLVGWIEVDWTPLLDRADIKGEDTDISHAPGRYVNHRQPDETEYVCEGSLFADRDRDGNELGGDLAECRAQLRNHLAFWDGYIASPRGVGVDPLRTFTLYGDPDWGAEVIIPPRLQLKRVSPVLFDIIVRVIVPAGELVQVGS